MFDKLEKQPTILAQEILEQTVGTPLEKEGEEKALSLLTAVEREPLMMFTPIGKQEEFIKAIEEASQEKHISTVALFAANGIGKTLLALHILCNFIRTPKITQNSWFDYPIFHNFPYPKLVWICSRSNALEGIVKTLCRLLGLDIKNDVKKLSSKYHSMTVGDWEIVFKTFNQDPQEYESSTVGLIIIDEPPPEHLWTPMKSRTRKGAIVLLALTPLDLPPYLIDEIDKKIEKKEKGVRKVEATLLDACYEDERGIRGHYSKEEVLTEISKYSQEEEVEARIYGKPTYFSSKIFADFDPKIHIVTPEEKPLKKEYEYFHIVDPHDSRPNAMIWAARTPEGEYIIFEESPSIEKFGDKHYWELKDCPLTIEDEIEIMKEVEQKWKVNFIRKRIIDRHFGNQTRGVKGTTIRDEFRKRGYYFMPSYKGGKDEVEYGHEIVRSLLRKSDDNNTSFLFVYPHCVHTIDAFSFYTKQYDKDGKPKIVEKYKDFADVVRYLVCDRTPIKNKEPYPTFKEPKSLLDYFRNMV